MRKVTKQSAIGEKGVALIALRVSEMGHLWHPTGGVDAGIDGEIELRDPETGEVRNFRIGVQSKATEGAWAGETTEGFYWRAKPRDIEYWLGSNQPVILVCSRPRTGEAYWRNVQQWASGSKDRAAGIIDFDKRRDGLDASAAARFFVLEAREGAVVAPPGPEPRPERLRSNLLPVHWDTDVVWSVASPSADSGAVFQQALTAGAPRSDFVLRSGRLWSLSPLHADFLAAIEVTVSPRGDPLSDLADMGEGDSQTLLAELIRRSLVAQHWREIRWHGQLRLAYFKLFGEGRERRFNWAGGRGRTVVLPRESRKHEGLSGYRHDAARLGVRWLDGAWLVSVTPTYLFTHDGRKLSSFHADAVTKMKAFDRAAAVSQQLRMWEWLLTRPPTILDGDEQPPPFHLGSLIEVSMPVRPPEAAWKRAPEDLRNIDDGDEPATDDQGNLFGDGVGF